ncbi:MAG: flagellin lysine-N-methylase [Clostridia bacterium]
MTRKNIITAQYMNQFQCLGDTCEDTCCQGWYVDIDKKTFVKYHKITDKKVKKKLQNHVKRNKMKTTFTDYATIKFPKGGFCPFLNGNKLCSIQLELGSSYLSRTCATYPRQYNQVFEQFELTGTCSCPEVARLVLLNRDAFAMQESEEKISADPVIDHLLEEEELRPLFEHVRQFVLNLLTYRSITLEERLLVLGTFLHELDYEDPAHVMERMEAYEARLSNGQLAELYADLPVEPEVQFAFLRQNIETHVQHSITNERYLDLFRQCRLGWETEERYQEAYQRWYVPFFQEHAYILENYLINYCIGQLFPFSSMYKEQTPFEDWLILSLHFILIKHHLISLSYATQGLTPELCVHMIQSFSRTYEHDVTYFENELKHLYLDELATLPFLSILLRTS